MIVTLTEAEAALIYSFCEFVGLPHTKLHKSIKTKIACKASEVGLQITSDNVRAVLIKQGLSK